MKVTFIGLGIMGSRMAANLLKHQVELTVWNRSVASMNALEKKGAIVAASAQEAVKDADLVFSMLSTPEVVEALFLGQEGLLSMMKKNALWVDCSTVNPSFSDLASKAASRSGQVFVDAPVAGTKPQAENAELVFFIGAEKVVLARIRPYLDMMGKKVLHLGKTTKGAAFKMLVNILLAQSMLIFSEAVLLGEKLGLSKEFLLDTLPNLVVTAPFTKFKAEMIRTSDYEVQFPLEWMHKDLHLAAITAYEQEQPLYLANLAKELFAEAKMAGMGRLDFASIYQYLARR